MAKKYVEKHNISIEGILNLEDMTIEVEDIGVKELSKVLEKVDGCSVKISITLSNDLD